MHQYTESEILLPRGPVQHSDDWPIFNLSQVEVYHPSDPDKAVNLLHAGADNALTIRGKLSPSGLSRHLTTTAKNTLHKSHRVAIEIPEVRQYAYGQYADGSIEVWAAGSAGWYSIRPAQPYKEIYLEDVVPAIELLYFAVDAHRSMKSNSKREASDVFRQWAEEKAMDEDEAARDFYRHRRFLLTSMLGCKEGISWSRNPLYKHLSAKYPEDVDICKQRLGLRPAKNSKSATPSSQAGTKRKRTSATVQSPDTTRSSVVGNDTIRVRSATAESGNSEQASAVDSVDHAEHTRHRRKRLRSSEDESVANLKITTDGAASDSSEHTSSGAHGKKGKSVLRPRPSKYIPKATSAEESDEKPPSSPVRPLTVADRVIPDKASGKAIAPGPALIRRRSSRRSAADVQQAVGGAKHVDEGIDMSLDQADEEEEDDPTAAIITGGTVSLNGMPFKLQARDLEATGDGDTWMCPLDGCMHRIYAASEPASQKMIKEHYRLHVNDEDAETRLQLLKRMQAPGLPVNRLMSRIHMLAGQKGFPAPITRQY